MKNCKKCGGILIKDYEDMNCILCGYIEYNIPTSIKEDVDQARGKNFIERNQKEVNYYYDKEDKLFGVEK